MHRIFEKLFLAALLCVCGTRGKEMTEIEALGAQPTHCTYEYAFEMYGAHCASRRLSKIPNLKSDIEILDFSDNKLQELSADTLSSYTSIKFLYLADNHIYLIEEDALTSLTDLETLDLTNNVILELPNSIFQLTSLRKLYLRGNPIFYRNLKALTIVKPIKAPLELLDISDCKIRELPDWGFLPQLVTYNISHNPLASLNTHHFASICNLGKVDLTESLNSLKLCGIRSTILWFQQKRIFFQLEDYSRLNTREFENCPVPEDDGSHNATFHRCKAEYLQVFSWLGVEDASTLLNSGGQKVQSIRTARRKWLTIGGGLGGFFVAFILLLYVMHRHNVAQTKTTAEKIKHATPTDADKNVSAVLLSDVA